MSAIFFEFSKTASIGVINDVDVVKISCYARACQLVKFINSSPAGIFSLDQGFRMLENLILGTRACKATDVRDKIFSMLGLVDPEFWDLKADYRCSVEEILTGAARRIIYKKQSLEILMGCQNPHRRHGLPSWVPNLIDPWRAHPFTDVQKDCVSDHLDFTFEGEKQDVLRAQGCLVGIVGKLNNATPGENASIAELNMVNANWKEFYAASAVTRTDPMDDKQWSEFLSGYPKSKFTFGATSKETRRAVKNLLLPPEVDTSTPPFDNRRKIIENLSKFGVGRRLCEIRCQRNMPNLFSFGASTVTHRTEEEIRVGLVPSDTKLGDEIWDFRGSALPRVLRKIDNDKYVVVGEACQ
jgi:hypothetical protein